MTNQSTRFDPELGKIEIDVDNVHIILSWFKEPIEGARMFVTVKDKVWAQADYGEHILVTKGFLTKCLNGRDIVLPPMREYFEWSHEFGEKVRKALIEAITALEDPEPPKTFGPSGSVTAKVGDTEAILSWFPKPIGGHVYFYCNGRAVPRIDFNFANPRKEFILKQLTDRGHRNAIARSLNLEVEEMSLLDQLAEQVEALQMPNA